MSGPWKRHQHWKPGPIFKTVYGVLLAVLLLGLVALLVVYNEANKPLWFLTGKVVDRGSYMVYRPGSLPAGRPVTLVFALSPGADALGMLTAWSGVAESHGWLVAASKVFANGQDFYPSLKEVRIELDSVEANYSVDPHRVIFTGISGGGMGSHGFARTYPDRVAAIVINTGMISATLPTGYYPEGKLAVFLASPTDFRYHEMQRDRDFLTGLGWQVDWIEFPGGHVLAPPAVYEQAAAWLETRMPPSP